MEPELKKVFWPNLVDDLPIVLLDGQVAGGQAISSYADKTGFFVGAMRRKDDMNEMRDKLPNLPPAGKTYAWQQLQIDCLLFA